MLTQIVDVNWKKNNPKKIEIDTKIKKRLNTYLGMWFEWFELIIAIAVLRRAIASVTNADVIGTLVIGGAICAAVCIGNGVQQNPWASIVTALQWTTKKGNLQ